MQNWGSRCFFLLLSLVICGCDRSSKCTERKHSLYFKYVLFHQPTRHGGQESVMQQCFYLGSELHVKWKCHCLKAKRASLWPTEEFDLCSAAAVVQVSTRRARILLSSWVTMFIYEGFHHGPKISKTNIKMKVKIKVLLLICFYSSKCTKKMHWHSKQEILEMKQKKIHTGCLITVQSFMILCLPGLPRCDHPVQRRGQVQRDLHPHHPHAGGGHAQRDLHRVRHAQREAQRLQGQSKKSLTLLSTVSSRFKSLRLVFAPYEYYFSLVDLFPAKVLQRNFCGGILKTMVHANLC